MTQTEKVTIYYVITDEYYEDYKQLAKYDQGLPYLYVKGQWVKDDRHEIWDRLHGYDETEKGTGYDTWNFSIMKTIHEITEDIALEFIQKSSLK
jgi:hypothetical protein